MIQKLLAVIEFLLVVLCFIFFFAVRMLELLAKFIAFVVIFLLLVFGFASIGQVPHPYQGIVLLTVIFGGGFIFLCVLILHMWKPEKVENISKTMNSF